MLLSRRPNPAAGSGPSGTERRFEHFLGLETPALDMLQPKDDDCKSASSNSSAKAAIPSEFADTDCTPEEAALAKNNQKMRRRLQNRRAAKVSRARKKKYIAKLEAQTTRLKKQIEALQTRNKMLETRVSVLEKDACPCALQKNSTSEQRHKDTKSHTLKDASDHDKPDSKKETTIPSKPCGGAIRRREQVAENRRKERFSPYKSSSGVAAFPNSSFPVSAGGLMKLPPPVPSGVTMSVDEPLGNLFEFSLRDQYDGSDFLGNSGSIEKLIDIIQQNSSQSSVLSEELDRQLSPSAMEQEDDIGIQKISSLNNATGTSPDTKPFSGLASSAARIEHPQQLEPLENGLVSQRMLVYHVASQSKVPHLESFPISRNLSATVSPLLPTQSEFQYQSARKNVDISQQYQVIAVYLLSVVSALFAASFSIFPCSIVGTQTDARYLHVSTPSQFGLKQPSINMGEFSVRDSSKRCGIHRKEGFPMAASQRIFTKQLYSAG